METRKRIDEQLGFIATLRPGSNAHRTAVALLLLYQDSLHLLTETDQLLEQVKQANIDKPKRDGG